MKILLILESYHPNIGGVETLFRSIAESLAEKGHSVSILTNKSSKGLPFKETSGKCTVYRYPFINRYLFTLLAFFPAVIFSRTHDLIHTTSYNAGIPSFFAGLLTGKKVIITFHEVWDKLWFELPFFGKLKRRLHYYYEKFLLQLPFYRFIAVSEFTKQQLLNAGIPHSKIIMIYNGIDYPKFQAFRRKYKPIERDHFTFLYFGRVGISKGLDVLLHAVQLMAREREKFKLVMVIPSQPKAMFTKIKNLIDSLSIKGHIELFHELPEPDLFEKVCSADCVVIPSYSEGFCYTAVEANALGRPIISSFRGALKEVVSGKHIYYENQNPADLCNAMKKAILGKWCVREQQYFRIEETLDNYLKVYREIIRS